MRIDAESETLIACGRELAGTVKERMRGETDDVLDSCVVAHALRADGFDASEDGTGRGTPLVPVTFDWQKGSDVTNPRPSTMNIAEDQSLTLGSTRTPAVAFTCKDHGADAGEVAPTLRGMGHDGSHANAGGQVAVAFDTTQITSRANYSNPKPGDPCHPLAAGAHPPSIAGYLSPRVIRNSDSANEFGVKGGSVSDCLQSDGPGAVAFQESQTGCREYESAGTLRADGPGHDPVGARVRSGMAVRRLTPRECERLQGFSDDFTLIAYRGKLAADGPRYKALGNSMARPVVRWIGLRIIEATA